MLLLELFVFSSLLLKINKKSCPSFGCVSIIVNSEIVDIFVIASLSRILFFSSTANANDLASISEEVIDSNVNSTETAIERSEMVSVPEPIQGEYGFHGV